MNRSLLAACALALLALSLPAAAEKRSHPSPTTTARRSGNTVPSARNHGRKPDGADVPTRKHGSRVNVRSAAEGRRPPAAKISVRKAR
jgi:hypothetical protein